MSYKSKAHLYLIISLVIGICLSVVLLLDLRFSQAATPESASLAPIYTIELVPDQMTLDGDVTTRDNCIHPTVCSWLDDTPTGTIMLGVDPTSPDPLTWDGGSATAEIPLTDFYSPTVWMLKLSWPDRDGKGLHSPERNRTGAITLDGQPLWGKRTTHLSTFNDHYYAAEHGPILTTIVITQSITHTLSFSVSARTAWHLSRIELSAYPYPTMTKGIGYSPYRDCQYPGGDSQPSVQAVGEDLFRLFHTTNAIRTYSAIGVNGQIPALANAIGLPIYAGAWIDYPETTLAQDDDEIQALINLACTTDLEGVIVGNEYYLRHRTTDDINYLLQRIREVKDGIRQCGKDVPVTTAEIDNLMFIWENLDDFDPEINSDYRRIFDEIDFIMVHTYPFWNGMSIEGAAAFTVNRYKAIQESIERDYPGQNKWVIIGEAGWPSAGAPCYGEDAHSGEAGWLSAGTSQGPALPSLKNQRCYLLEFLSLAEQEGVEYMYFDAFDELWKIEEPGRVGQNWGYSYSDRTAKHNFYGVLLPAEQLPESEHCSSYVVYLPYIACSGCSRTFPVYTEWPMGPDDHFVPSGWMGITETLNLYECDRANPHSGEMAIRASFSPTGTDSWGGIYWQHPEKNWGDVEEAGINLDDATYLRFYARGEEGGEQVKFLMGGIWGEYPDSQQPALSTDVITLTQEWLTYTIDLRGRDLSRVIGGFAFVADDCLNPEPITFYLDDIEYVLEGDPGAPTPTPTPETPYTFDVYRDKDIAGNHYVPSGWMGDTGDIILDECWREDTHTGSTTAIRVEYTAQGEEPYECGGLSPCGWAGVYWQDPAKNWGDRPGGYDLTGARALTFWAKGREGGEKISFKVGGIGCDSAPYPDSLCPVHILDPAPIGLTDTWRVYTIPLGADLDLSKVVGGFLWAASKRNNPGGATFYLDDIQYLFNIDLPNSPFPAPGPLFGTGSERTFDLAFGDADKDGDLDLAVGNHGLNQICWNGGDGIFDCVNAFGGSATFDVEWGDMDNDDDLDLVVANSQGRWNLVCLNDSGTFTCTGFSTCPGSKQVCRIALGDVDGDDDLDIALAIWQPQDLIYFNAGDGTFPITATTCTDSGWTRDLHFGDVDNDDDLDLVVVGDSPDYVCINDGTGTFTETRWLPWRYQDSTRSVALGDVDGDGYLDIATGENTLDPIKVHLNSGHGYFPETLHVGPASDLTHGIALGDVDNDGDLDIAAGNLGQYNVVYFNDPVSATNSVTFIRRILLGTGPYNTRSLAFGDVDGDCDLDLAMSHDRGQNVIYLNTLLGGCAHLPIILKDCP